MIKYIKREVEIMNKKAIEELYNELGFENADSFAEDYKNDIVTENTCRNGRKVIWYIDSVKCAAIYEDTLEFLTEEEIEKELC